jgi:RHS repeat-associated protein
MKVELQYDYQKRLYTGREFLKEAKLYDYRNRVYSAELGRFLQTDPIRFDAGDGNLYRYVGNRVTVWIDPDGTISVGEIICFVFEWIAQEQAPRPVPPPPNPPAPQVTPVLPPPNPFPNVNTGPFRLLPSGGGAGGIIGGSGSGMPPTNDRNGPINYSR